MNLQNFFRILDLIALKIVLIAVNYNCTDFYEECTLRSESYINQS